MAEYVTGSGLEIPGLEAIMEYGDSSVLDSEGRIKGAMRINDRSVLEQVRVDHITGLHDDPDGRDSRQPRSDQHGEDPGTMLYGGRTIGLTGSVRAGSIPAVRDVWRKFRSQFGTIERDLLIHPIGEVATSRNMIQDPRFASGVSLWSLVTTSGSASAPSAATLDSMTVGRFAVTGVTSSAVIRAVRNNTGLLTTFTQWDGEDVFVGALVKIESATGSVGSINVALNSIKVASDGSWTSTIDQTAHVELSPTTGSWIWISGRVSASLIDVDTDYLTAEIDVNLVSSGDVTFSVTRVMMVLLESDQATPLGFFDGDVPGFDWEGQSSGSSSIGPSYAVNQFIDPQSTQNTAWSSANDSGAINVIGPTSTSRWAGGQSNRSIYWSSTSGASDKVLAIKTAETTVYQGRTYKFYVKVNVDQMDAGSIIDVHLRWLDQSLGTISDVTQSYTVDGGAGVVDVAISGTAPANAFQALVLVGNIDHKNTAPSQVLSLYVTDPCLVDVSEYDPGQFVGAGGTYNEVTTETGVKRRIPRPFLIKGVRKTSDMKAPEQQDGPNAWRDFTMSLRASDPRVYVLDERRESLKLSGSPQFVAVGGEVFTLDTTNVPVPTGFTSEGSTNTTGYGWSTRNTAPGRTSETNHPLGGVGHKDWQTPVGSGAAPDLNTQLTAGNDMLTRYYRSAEGYTYTKPRVVLGCHPAGRIRNINLGEGWAWNNLTGASAAYYVNAATILLKRVSSTTWLELRWNAMAHAFAQAQSAWGASDNAPYAFELWCSHNTSGTLATTRLAQVDYVSVDSSSTRSVPFDPVNQPMWLVAWLDSSNIVYWELWKSYPSIIDTSNRVESGSYTLPSGLASVIGDAVAGNTGWALKTAGVDDINNWQFTASNPPFMHYFEASKYDAPAQSVDVPMIGSAGIDTPPAIVLGGGVVNPVVSMTVPQEDGTTETVSARFIGTFDEGNPVTIDLNEGTIKDSNGSNAYSTIQPGGGFLNFRPGVNTISVQAENWDTSAAEHLVVRWRDALS